MRWEGGLFAASFTFYLRPLGPGFSLTRLAAFFLLAGAKHNENFVKGKRLLTYEAPTQTRQIHPQTRAAQKNARANYQHKIHPISFSQPANLWPPRARAS